MDTLSDDLEVLWGLYHDDTIGEQVKVAIVATGFDKVRSQEDMEEKNENIMRLWKIYYPESIPQKSEDRIEEDNVRVIENVEDEPVTDVERTPANWKERGHTWLNNFVDFVKRSLEEGE